MATRLHLLTLREQYALRQQRRTNRRLLFVAAFVGLIAFCVGLLSGCGSSVEATAEERVAPPVTCGTTEQPCPRVG
jgi:uncharacterized membrane protein (DUF4010 family)